MKKLLLAGLSAALFVLPSQAAPDPIYENFGVVDFGTNAPQIDATAFANYGSFLVASLFPYDTQNTLNYTNTGSMIGGVGFRFEFVPPLGKTLPANSFVNTGGASITDLALFLNPYDDMFFPPSYILVNATNIQSQGIMSLTTGGLVELKGSSVDLNRGGIEFRPLDGGFGGYVPTTDDPPEFFVQFFPDLGIRDAGASTNLNENYFPGGLVNFLPGETNVVVSGGPIQMLNPLSYVSANRVGPSNVTVQAAFVGVNSANLGVRTRFLPTGNTPLQTITVELSMTSSNEVTASEIDSTLYVIDRMGSHTNSHTLAVNLDSGTGRPGNLELTRFQPFEFVFGDASNFDLVPGLFFNDTFTNVIVTNYNAAYQADVDFLAARPRPVPAFTPELLSGRLEIEADVLDLSRTRIRGEGYMNINTKHLVGSAGAAIEAEYLSFNLDSTNGLLRVQNLARDGMRRLRGQPLMWSAIWTNLSGETVTNIIEDPMDPTMMVTNVMTNTLEYVFHVLLLQAGSLGQQVPITTWNFKTESTNTVILDNLVVQNEFIVNGEGLEISGDVSFPGTGRLRSWEGTNAPNLRFFTNSGGFSTLSSASFGSDRDIPYERFVNRGSLNPFSLSVDADEFENAGLISGQGRFDLWTRTGKLDGGESFFGGDVSLMARDIKFRNYTNQTQSRLNLMVTNSLVDSGGDAGSRLNVNRGFHLLVKPVEGDLLGTTLATAAPRFASVLNRWAADDLGATAEGFSNNVAVGRLILSPAQNAELVLQGMGTSNAMYVDLLELAGTAVNDLENSVRIDTNLVVYFAYANQPVEELDGRLDGRLRWVRDFAGPNSSVEVLLANGRTILVNRGLRESRTIDSDGDGLANFFDPFPFDDVVITSTQVFAGDPPRLEISWRAAANTVYTIDYSTSMAVPEWQELMNYTNAVPTNRVVTVEDELPEGTPQRFYRVRYTP